MPANTSVERARVEPVTNVSGVERWITGLAGAGLALWAVTRRTRLGGALAVLGAGMLYRASTGYCPAYDAAGRKDLSPRSRVARRFSGSRGIHVEAATTVGRPVSEVYAFWRRLENLGRFMENVESVTESGPGLSHWLVRGPAGATVEWDAKIVNEEPGRVIGWQTVEGATVASAGSVNFRETSDGQATEVRVRLQYDPPAGKLGGAIASLLGSDPHGQISRDLERMKQVLEGAASR